MSIQPIYLKREKVIEMKRFKAAAAAFSLLFMMNITGCANYTDTDTTELPQAVSAEDIIGSDSLTETSSVSAEKMSDPVGASDSSVSSASISIKETSAS